MLGIESLATWIVFLILRLVAVAEKYILPVYEDSQLESSRSIMQTRDVFKKVNIEYDKKNCHNSSSVEKSFSQSKRHYVLVLFHFILNNHRLFEEKNILLVR